jgi:hypothetical protein
MTDRKILHVTKISGVMGGHIYEPEEYQENIFKHFSGGRNYVDRQYLYCEMKDVAELHGYEINIRGEYEDD